MAEPEFTKDELAILDGIRKSPLWEKILQHIDSRLVSGVLDTRRNDITPDVRRGYLWARVELQDLPSSPPEPKPDDIRTTSIQYSDDDVTERDDQ